MLPHVCSFVDIIRALPNKLQLLEDIIDQTLKQTVECAIFIREYTGHRFRGRLVRQTLSDSAHKIADFKSGQIGQKGISEASQCHLNECLASRIIRNSQRCAYIYH
ncbi:hypothetical protein PILCRDRAFT_448868 [Piloderma croceum F 1598]|uniref:Uncharacterized protein n=1 Tax=Piloderma croceum (strain F 1598) TaxID=765440 RepID=A0A0C3C090_PILCF|nr:hypothetical protein PILCRDRAFT_448868 [Piloderma croceum F 1598]